MAATGTGFISCSKTDAEIDEGKTPSVSYVRYCDPDEANNHLEGAFLGETVAIMGANLGDVQEIWFNDQKATLNPTYVTSSSVIVTIPTVISENITDKMRLISSKGHECTYDFAVLIPVPQVNAIDNEWANPGDEVTISGLYMVDYDDSPLQIEFPGGVKVPHEDMVIADHTGVTFKVPQGATEGRVLVTSRYGTGYSNFTYRDTRGMLIDWDGVRGQGIARTNGWRDGSKIVTDSFEGIPALDGNYACFNTVKSDYNAMDEDNASFNHWSQYDGEGHVPGLNPADLFDTANWQDYTLKFEAFVPEYNPWTICSLNIIWSKAEQNNDNAYLFDDTWPRALWTPWEKTGSYTTGGKWVTISVPLANTNQTRFAEACPTAIDSSCFRGLSFIVCWGPASELTDQRVILAVDNIRIAPINEEMPETVQKLHRK